MFYSYRDSVKKLFQESEIFIIAIIELKTILERLGS